MPRPRVGGTSNYPPAPHCSSFVAPNEVVCSDGSFKSGHRENEDRVFHCVCPDNEAELYMVLDGHDGTNACDFVKEFLPGELFNRLNGSLGRPEEVRMIINDTFLETETRFFLSIDHILTQKMTLQFELGELGAVYAAKQYPNQMEQIERLNRQIRGGTSVVMALIFKGYLYVANVGDSRAILCQQDSQGTHINSKQLSEDHTVANEKEITRLTNLGLSKSWLKQTGRLGPSEITRCIGDYWIKGGYTEMVEIKVARKEPGTAEPYVANPIPLRDMSKCFLLLMSDGLYKAYQCRYHPDYLSYLVAREMKEVHPANFVELAQYVVNSVRATFRSFCKESYVTETTDDMSLVVRNFGFDAHFQRAMSLQSSAVGYRPVGGSNPPTTAPVLPSEGSQFRWGGGGFGAPGTTGPAPYDVQTFTRKPPQPPDHSLGSPTTIRLSNSLSSLQLEEALHPNQGMSASCSSTQLRGAGMGRAGHDSPGAWSHHFQPEPHPLVGPHAAYQPPAGPHPLSVNPGGSSHPNMTPTSGVPPKPTGNPPMVSNASPSVGTPLGGDPPPPASEGRTLTRQVATGSNPSIDNGDDVVDSGDGEDETSGVIVIHSDLPEEEIVEDGKIKPYISFDASVPADLSFDML